MERVWAPTLAEEQSIGNGGRIADRSHAKGGEGDGNWGFGAWNLKTLKMDSEEVADVVGLREGRFSELVASHTIPIPILNISYITIIYDFYLTKLIIAICRLRIIMIFNIYG